VAAMTGDPRTDELLDGTAPLLGELLEDLTRRQREIARLMLVEGLRQSEVADRLGGSRATVSVAAERAHIRSIGELARVDRTKIVLTRRAAVAALRAAHERHEGPQPIEHLGRAWTSRPAALFLADQIAHLVLIGIAFGFIPPHASLEPAWVDTVNWVLGPSHDRAAVHQIVSVVVVLLTLLIANVRAASIFVAILVRPVEEGEGGIRWGGRVEAESA